MNASRTQWIVERLEHVMAALTIINQVVDSESDSPDDRGFDIFNQAIISEVGLLLDPRNTNIVATFNTITTCYAKWRNARAEYADAKRKNIEPVNDYASILQRGRAIRIQTQQLESMIRNHVCDLYQPIIE